MTFTCRVVVASAALFAALAAPAAAGADEVGDRLARMMAFESEMQGKTLEKAIAKAAEHPLGSSNNPVRAAGPAGQRAYLARLRCEDGSPPGFYRAGNLGPGVYWNIVDAYEVTCAGMEPVTVVMDMYHSGHVEQLAVPGFTITP